MKELNTTINSKESDKPVKPASTNSINKVTIKETIPETVTDFSNEKKYLNTIFEQCEYKKLIEEIKTLNLSLLSRQDKKFILTLKGKSDANLGNLEDSLKACESLIQLDKLDIDSYFLHASILIEMGKINTAANELNKILYLDSSHIMSHFMLGNILRTEDRNNEANKHMQRALTLLKNEPQDKVLEKSEGLTVNRMIEIITTLLKAQGIEQ